MSAVTKNIDFSYQVEFDINADRKEVESLLSESFPGARFYHHNWNGNNFSAWILMINENRLKIRVNYGSGGYYLDCAVDNLTSLINDVSIHTPSVEEEIKEVATMLKNREVNPRGTFDKAGRFYATHANLISVRSPSRAYPYSQMQACRTVKYVRAVAGYFNCKTKDEILRYI